MQMTLVWKMKRKKRTAALHAVVVVGVKNSSMSALEANTLKIKATYSFDEFLMYLVQDITKRSSADILNFFHELGRQVSEVGFSNMKGSSIHKKITDYFPGTSVPFHLLVKGAKQNGRWNPSTRRYENVEAYYCSVEVGFPDKGTYIEEKDLNDISVKLMEKSLLGREEVGIASFTRPNISTPRMYVKIMSAFTGRPEPEKKQRKKKKTKPVECVFC